MTVPSATCRDPVRVTGTNADPKYEGLPGLSPQNDAIAAAPFFTRAVTLDPEQQPPDR